MKKLLFYTQNLLVIILSLNFVCNSFAKEERNVQKISKSEAILIAQQLMMEKDLQKHWNLQKPKIKYENENEIVIKFYSKHRFALDMKYALPYLVVVSKQDGSITAFGQDK